MEIYKVTNKINGKAYIGKTSKGLERRMAEHLKSASHGSQHVFHKAIRKYGSQSFEWFIVDIADSLDILNEKEIYWISYFNTKIPNGYNITDGGDGGPIMKGNDNPSKRPAVRKKLSEASRGRTCSKETVLKISQSLKGHSYSIGEKNGMYGKHHSQGTKKKMSKDRKGKPKSEATRKKIGESIKGKKRPDLVEYNRNRKLRPVPMPNPGLLGEICRA